MCLYSYRQNQVKQCRMVSRSCQADLVITNDLLRVIISDLMRPLTDNCLQIYSIIKC